MKIGPPPIQTPVQDATGRITEPWVKWCTQVSKFMATQQTGTGSATLGANCPAGTLTPYTWIRATAPDGTEGVMPFFKL